jgi:mRNA interferase RelE/StbE
MYELRYEPRAKKYFKKIKEKGLKDEFQKKLIEIATNPYSGELKKGDLTGTYGYDVFYNKTNYKIAYRIEELNGKIVVVILAGTHENFYSELKRYLKEL